MTLISQVLMLGSQTINLIPCQLVGHITQIKTPKDELKPTFDIKVSKPFNSILGAKVGPCLLFPNLPQKSKRHVRTLTFKVENNFGVLGLIISHLLECV